MKKVFTLLLAAGLFIAADAQPITGRTHVRTGVQVNIGIKNNPGYGFAADRRLREEAARINFKYDRKVQQVRNSIFMRPVVKARKIRTLEHKRQKELHRLYDRYSRNGRRY